MRLNEFTFRLFKAWEILRKAEEAQIFNLYDHSGNVIMSSEELKQRLQDDTINAITTAEHHTQRAFELVRRDLDGI